MLDKFVARYGRLPTEYDPDYLEMLRMGRHRVLSVPDASPGKCANCGASKDDGRGYIDVGLHVDWYGAVFFCGHCMKELATAMGLFIALEAHVEHLQNEITNFADLQEQGVNLHDSVAVIFKEVEEYYASVSTFATNPDSVSPPSVDVAETESSKSGTDETKSRATKSTNVSGRKDIPSLTELISDL